MSFEFAKVDYTTAYTREILSHHYCGTAPFPRQTDLYFEYVKEFVAQGLLIELPTENGHGSRIAANHEALQPYMEALAAVPLPVQRWVIP